MKLLIDIPDTDIPKRQDMLEIDIMFIDGHISQCTYPFEVLREEEKTGHWEWVQYDYNPKLGNWHCSECRCIVVECVGKGDKGGIPLYKYCPQCGIKMKSQESEDV